MKNNKISLNKTNNINNHCSRNFNSNKKMMNKLKKNKIKMKIIKKNNKTSIQNNKKNM